MCKGLLTKVGRGTGLRNTVPRCETEDGVGGTDGADSPDGGGAVILLIIQRYCSPIN